MPQSALASLRLCPIPSASGNPHPPTHEQGDVEIDDEGTSAVRQLASRIRHKKGVVKATAWTKRANNHSRMKGSVDAKKRSVGQVTLTFTLPLTLTLTLTLTSGLKADPPTGALFVSGENTLNSGEISRDLVADVSVAALFDAKASKKVVEIVESDKDGNAKTGIFNGLKM